MINETLEANRAYQRDKDDTYNRGYEQGKADAEPHWHPVSEQPQEDDDYLLLTYEHFKYGRFPRIIIGAWDGGEKVWLEYYEGMYRDVNPVAWISQEELLLLKGYEVTE